MSLEERQRLATTLVPLFVNHSCENLGLVSTPRGLIDQAPQRIETFGTLPGVAANRFWAKPSPPGLVA